MSFGADLRAFQKKVGITGDKVVRKVCLDLTRDLVLATPVDTGLARSSYFFGTERNASVGDTASKNGSPSITRSSEFASTLKAGGVFYITNNQVYIMRLEFGSSKQAPAGMARIAVARWQERLNGIVGQVNS